LATNDHISSSWTSRVRGGKSHPLVVDAPGVSAGQPGQPHDGVTVDPGEPFGLTDPVAFDQVFEDGDRLLLGQARMEQRRAPTFGEARLTRLAEEQPGLLEFAVTVADGEVAGVALTVERAVRVLTAEASEVVHGCDSFWVIARREIIGCKSQITWRLSR
jgi:hypothetical protein